MLFQVVLECCVPSGLNFEVLVIPLYVHFLRVACKHDGALLRLNVEIVTVIDFKTNQLQVGKEVVPLHHSAIPLRRKALTRANTGFMSCL